MDTNEMAWLAARWPESREKWGGVNPWSDPMFALQPRGESRHCVTNCCARCCTGGLTTSDSQHAAIVCNSMAISGV